MKLLAILVKNCVYFMFKSSDTLHEITIVKVRIILLLHVTHEHYMGGFCRPLALVCFTRV